MSRYTTLSEQEPKESYIGQPVQLEKIRVLLDTKEQKSLLQLRFFNLDDREIQSIYWNIVCLSDDGRELAVLEDVPCMGLFAKPHQSTAVPKAILLQGDHTYSVQVMVKRITFLNGTIWENQGEKKIIVIPQKPNYPDCLQQQLVREFIQCGLPLGYQYQEQSGFWICHCGQPNPEMVEKCGRCQSDHAWQKQVFSIEYLVVRSNEFERMEEERKVAVEERIRQGKEEEERQQQELERLLEEQKGYEEVEKERTKQKIHAIKRFCLRKSTIFSFLGIVVIVFSFSITMFALKESRTDEVFLSNLQKGLERRWEVPGEKDDSTEEKIKQTQRWYKSVLEAEYSCLGDFNDYTFHDKQIENLAERYFEGLRLQGEGYLYFGRDDEKFAATWDQGYSDRVLAIKQFVNTYHFSVSEKYQSILDDMMLDTVVSVEFDGKEYEFSSIEEMNLFVEEDSRVARYLKSEGIISNQCNEKDIELKDVSINNRQIACTIKNNTQKSIVLLGVALAIYDERDGIMGSTCITEGISKQEILPYQSLTMELATIDEGASFVKMLDYVYAEASTAATVYSAKFAETEKIVVQ